MNRQELLNRLYLNHQHIFDQQINDIPVTDSYAFVFQRQRDFTDMRNPSKLELATQAPVVTGLQETRSEQAMYLDGRPDDLLADRISWMIDESHEVTV